MNLRPEEAKLLRELLAHVADRSAPPPSPMAVFAFESRLAEEAPPLGAHVFRLVCKLGTDATKEVAANTKERKALRDQLGKKRLSGGEGPEKVVPLMAATMNEYNALEPYRKEAIRKAYDAEIEARKKEWPSWSCGSTDFLVSRPGKSLTCKKCKGIGVKLDRSGPTTKPCSVCKGNKIVEAPPLVKRDGGRKRAVVVTRESLFRPDEESLDAHLGAKFPIDRLVQAGVLRGDSHTWLVRYGLWMFAPAGQGRVTVDVYDIAPC